MSPIKGACWSFDQRGLLGVPPVAAFPPVATWLCSFIHFTNFPCRKYEVACLLHCEDYTDF